MILEYDDFEYEPMYEELREAIVEILCKKSNNYLIDLIYELHLEEDIKVINFDDKKSLCRAIYFAADDLRYIIEEEITEYFKPKAYEQQSEYEDYLSDPYGYYGVSYRDFM